MYDMTLFFMKQGPCLRGRGVTQPLIYHFLQWISTLSLLPQTLKFADVQTPAAIGRKKPLAGTLLQSVNTLTFLLLCFQLRLLPGRCIL